MAGITYIAIFAFVISAFTIKAALGDNCFGSRMRACSDGHCIASDFFCNGENDCGDWSDELNCESSVESDKEACPPNAFSCGSLHLCIPWVWICDGMPDCFNGRDEANCSNLNECKAGFKCGNECILKSWVCDGTVDCIDGSDENNCAVIEDEKPMETLVVPTDARKGGAIPNIEDVVPTGIGYTRKIEELVPHAVQTIKAAFEQILEAVSNPCSSSPCNNGICSPQDSINYMCKCPQGFTVASVKPFKCEWGVASNGINV